MLAYYRGASWMESGGYKKLLKAEQTSPPAEDEVHTHTHTHTHTRTHTEAPPWFPGVRMCMLHSFVLRALYEAHAVVCTCVCVCVCVCHTGS